ncbi:MAG: hypothetical protein WCO51_03775 [bacterium]|jgi:hypothetical protein
MPNIADVETTRSVRREITKRAIDSSLLDVHAMHGVVYLRGRLGILTGHDIDLRQEMEKILHTIRLKPGVREVIAEIEYPKK